MTLRMIDLPDVRRVQTDDGSHVAPALDAAWDERKRLAWKAALTAVETGLSIRLWSGASNDPIEQYAIGVGTGSTSAYDFDSAWSLLSGVSMGARAARVMGGAS